jgi:hypothetical protein
MSSENPVHAELVLPEGSTNTSDKSNGRAEPGAVGCGCLATIVTLLALLPGGCGMYWSNGAKRDVGEISIEQAENREMTPSGSFVTLRGTPDLETAAKIVGQGDNIGTILLTFDGASRLVIVCRENHPLAAALSDDSDDAALQNVTKEWQLEGRLYDGGDYMADTPSFQIYQYIMQDLGLPNLDDARVLIVGETAQGWVTKSYWAFGFAAILGLFAIIGWVATCREWMKSRSPPTVMRPG